MKLKMKLILAVFLIFLFSHSAESVMIKDMNVYVSPNEKKSFISYNLTFYENQSVVSLVTYYKIYGLNAFVGGKKVDCKLSENSIGSSVICKNVNAQNIRITFYSDNLIKNRNGILILSFGIPITDLINSTEVRVELPEGYVITSDKKLNGEKSFYPGNGVIGSSGRTIYIDWKFSRPKIGEYMRFYVYYEPASKNNFWLISVFVLIAIAGSFLIVSAMKNRSKMVLAALSNDEKKIMEMILKNKNLYQRDIVRETGFSKAKVSRILKNFEERGLIKRERRGRKSKIKLINFWVRK